MKLITVSREYGSGGRELAEKLAEKLGFTYYDKNIIKEISKKTSLDETFVENNLEKGVTAYPSHFGRGSYYSPIIRKDAIDVAVAQREIMLSIAKRGDAVIVGRAADVILKDEKPFNIFVFASIEARINRCRNKVEGFDKLTDKEIRKKMLAVDKERAKCREMLTDSKWGEREAYHLMINTTDKDIDKLIPAIAEYATEWFNEQ